MLVLHFTVLRLPLIRRNLSVYCDGMVLCLLLLQQY